MTNDELELAKVGAETILRPFSNLIERLFGGSVDEVGGMWQDSLKARRVVRQARLMQWVQEKLDAACITEPQQIPDNLWIPMLQEASLEDDETLQEMWASLITNAANPRQENSVHPTYLEILKQLSSREAWMLQYIERFGRDQEFSDFGLSVNYHETFEKDNETLHGGFDVIMDNLQRLELIRVVSGVYINPGHTPSTENYFKLTPLGYQFLKAVTAPNPVENRKQHESQTSYKVGIE